MRIITLEECFLHPALEQLYPSAYLKQLDLVREKLTDVGPARIRRMDAAGIDVQVLSHVQPGVQTLDSETAVRVATEVNDWLGDVVATYPTRFAGFATLATQDPVESACELQRTVSRYGFKGALVNGHTLGRYLDDASFSPLFDRAQALDVPIYIHPTNPPAPVMQTYYESYPAMAQSWGWMVETGTHLLRLMSGGIFDRYPDLKIIVGHMGELVPFGLERINRGLTMGNWLNDEGSRTSVTKPNVMERSIAEYMKKNVFITTSGFFDQQALSLSIAKLGIDNVLFSVDDPFGDNFEGVEFLEKAQLSPKDREKLAHGNAERVLNLSPSDTSTRRAGDYFFRTQSKLKSRIGRALLSYLVK